MRIAPTLLVVSAVLLSGCKVLLPVADVATRPFGKKGAFEEAQAAYTSNIRYGLYEEALAQVEPAHRARFQAELPRFRELRLSEARTESIEIDSASTEARAVVVIRGYWLSSPFEREKRIVQKWRRVGSVDWFVTPDFDALLTPARDVSRTSSLPLTR